MAVNLSIESPDFDLIRKQSGYAVEDAIRLLWNVLNEEQRSRRLGVREAKEKIEGKVKTDPSTSNQDNYDSEGAQTVYFTGGSALNVTGIRNGVEGRVIIFTTLGVGTITYKNNSASSDTANRIVTAGGADVAAATNKTFIVQYLNNRWREVSLA